MARRASAESLNQLRPAFVDCKDGRRELRLAGAVVTVFRKPAPDQELILMAFQEQHWRQRIDDPLCPKDGRNPKKRLHDAVKRLNRRQRGPYIRFHMDGSGQGVYWEFDDRIGPTLAPNRP